MQCEAQAAALAFIVILAGLAGCIGGNDGKASPLDFPGFWQDEDGNTHLDNSTTLFDGRVRSLTPDRLLAGEINQLTLRSDGPVALPLPPGVLPVAWVNDTYQVFNASYLELEADATFHLLVAPTATLLNLTLLGYGRFDYHLVATPGPDPLVSGAQVYDLMEAVTDDDNPPLFENGYNERYVGAYSPGLERGAIYFDSLFKSYGLESEVQRYNNPDTGALIINVVAIKWGLDRTTFIGVGGHMDVVAPVAPIPGYLGPGYGTIQGAYDDTSGTVQTLVLARALAPLQTQQTYFFGLWSAEEEGIWGSGEFVDNFAENYPGATIKAYLNLDMVGINWPGVDPDTGEYYPLYGMSGGNYAGGQTEQVHGYEAIVNWTAYHFMGYPNVTAFEFGHSSMGSSDHRSFQNIGVPTLFYIGTYDAGYDAYHRLEDTLSNMKEQMGGQTGLEAGFEVTIWLSLANLLLLDSEPAV